MVYALRELQNLAKVWSQESKGNVWECLMGTLDEWLSKCGPWTKSIRCERVGNSNHGPCLRSTESWTLGGRPRDPCLISSPGGFETPWSSRTTDVIDPLCFHFLSLQAPSSAALLLRAVVSDQKHWHHIGARKCRMLGPTPDLLNPILCLQRSPRDLHARWSVRSLLYSRGVRTPTLWELCCVSLFASPWPKPLGGRGDAP